MMLIILGIMGSIIELHARCFFFFLLCFVLNASDQFIFDSCWDGETVKWCWSMIFEFWFHVPLLLNFSILSLASFRVYFLLLELFYLYFLIAVFFFCVGTLLNFLMRSSTSTSKSILIVASNSPLVALLIILESIKWVRAALAKATTYGRSRQEVESCCCCWEKKIVERREWSY